MINGVTYGNKYNPKTPKKKNNKLPPWPPTASEAMMVQIDEANYHAENLSYQTAKLR